MNLNYPPELTVDLNLSPLEQAVEDELEELRKNYRRVHKHFTLHGDWYQNVLSSLPGKPDDYKLSIDTPASRVGLDIRAFGNQALLNEICQVLYFEHELRAGSKPEPGKTEWGAFWDDKNYKTRLWLYFECSEPLTTIPEPPERDSE